MNPQQSQPFHASARLISPVLLLPPLPDIDDCHDDLAGPRLQNQMFDAASNFPAPRKQNIACDACRSRKVRCHQVPGQERCTHCQSKNYPCTHYVQQATSDRKRTGNGASSRPSKSRNGSTNSPVDLTGSSANGTATPSPNPGTSALALSLSPSPLGSPGAGGNSTTALLLWLFSPVRSAALPPHVGGASFQATRALLLAAGKSGTDAFRSATRSSPEADWGEVGRKLMDVTFLAEFALDLIEVYMQICHTRQPILDPIDFRSRFKISLPSHLQPPDTPPMAHNWEPIPPALLAVVLAWGAKFSEHPLLILDREQNNGRSRVSRALTNKAIQIAEGEKVYRLPTTENILTCMIIEGIQSHSKSDPDRYNKFWVDNAIRMMQELGINRQPDEQNSLVFCWWIACLSDAIGAAYLRRKPVLDDDDYDTKNLAGATFGAVGDPVIPAGVQAAYLSWYTSLHALAQIIRQMCRWLWIPASETDGIPYDHLVQLVSLYHAWRDEHLDRVGVPSNFEADWDFVAAVTACSSDATFHLMWIIMAQALEDYGIKEFNEMARMGEPLPANVVEFEELKASIDEEAHHGAVRIAGLAGVLKNNSYLRLDPNALHYGIYAAGHVLARSGQPEVADCIEGLKQYGQAFEDAFDQAAELEQIYAATLATRGSPLSPSHQQLQHQQQHTQYSPAGQAHAMAMAFTNSPQANFQSPNFQSNFNSDFDMY